MKIKRKEKAIVIVAILILGVSMTVFLTQGEKYWTDSTTEKSVASTVASSDSDMEVIWDRIWGDVGHDYGYSVWGNGVYLYTCGYSDSFDTGDYDLVLIKWDTNGNVVWYRIWGGANSDYGYSVWGDGTYVYTCGYTDSFGAGYYDLILIKWDTNGNVVWNCTWGGANSDYGRSVWGDGIYLYTCGYTRSFGAGWYDLVLIKWDTNGNVVWYKTFGDIDYDHGYSVWGDGTYVYTTGYTEDPNTGDYDLALIKWDTNGNVVWDKTWDGGSRDYGYSVWGDGTYIYTCGETNIFGAFSYDLALIKWDTNGNVVWYRIWGGGGFDYGYSVWGDGTYIYTCGEALDTGYYDLALIKWDRDGNVVWDSVWGDWYRDENGYSVWGDGTYVYTCGKTYNSDDPETRDDFILVKWGLGNVTDIIAPTITTPSDITYEQATTGHKITWVATDTNPYTYIIYRDGLELTYGTWTSGVPITINVDGLNIGSYNYTIVVSDAYGNSARDTVFVTVTPTLPEDTPEDGIPGYPLIILVIAMVTMIGVIAFRRQRH